MGKPRALDLCCKAGGATKGLQEAGFHVTGVDIEPQPRYCGDVFILGDALTVDLGGYDFVWASVPCEGYSEATPLHIRERFPRLIEPMRERFIVAGVRYVIENVAGARRELRNPLMLCGSMFGLAVWRHRYFEMPGIWGLTPACDHSERPVTIHSGSNSRRLRGNTTVADMGAAMGIDWMRKEELAKAIPPAYSKFIGQQALRALGIEVAA